MFWEPAPYSTNITSDWLTVDEEEIKIKWMTVSLGSLLASEGTCLFVDLWEAQPCVADPE